MGKEPLTEERLAEIRGREKVATQGPWAVQDKGAIPLIYGPDGERVAKVIDHQEDAAFIAHAREDIPALLDEVERLRAENEQLKEIAWNGIELMDKAVIREAAREIDMVREKVLRHAMEQEKRRFS